MLPRSFPLTAGCLLLDFGRASQLSAVPAESIAYAARAFGQDDDITVLTLTLAPAEVLHA
jgi:hypothetical protein